MKSYKAILSIVAIISFSVMFSISIVGPLLNELSIRENIPLGANPNTAIGIIFSLGGFSLAIFQMPFAKLAYKIGRKMIIFIGSILLGLSIILIGYVGDISASIGLLGLKIIGIDISLALLSLFRIFQGMFAAATWPILMAIIAVYFKEDKIGLAMGIFGASFGLGMAFGPVLGPALVALSNIHTPFLLAGLLSVISAFTVFKLPKEEKTEEYSRRIKFILDKRLIILSLIAFTLLYIMGSIVVIYPRYMRNYLNLDVKAVAMAMAASGLTYTLLQPITGKIADKFNKKSIIILGLIPLILITSSFGFIKDLNSILILMTIFGVLAGFVFPASNALLGLISPKGMENMYSAFYNMMLSFGVTVSPIVVGILSDLAGYSYAYLSNGILTLITLILFTITYKEY